jgi:hypothetical protein
MAMPSRSTARSWLAGLLRFDSLTAPLAVGARSGGAAPRWMLFDAGDYTVGLRVITRGNMRAVAGQVLGANGGGDLSLSSGSVNASVVLNEFCEFEVGPLPAGTYQLKIGLSEADIQVSELSLS